MKRRAVLFPIEIRFLYHHGKPRAPVRFGGEMLPDAAVSIRGAPGRRALCEGILRFQAELPLFFNKDAVRKEREDLFLPDPFKDIAGRRKRLFPLFVGKIQTVIIPKPVPGIGELEGRHILPCDPEAAERICPETCFVNGRNAFIQVASKWFGPEMTAADGRISELQRYTAEREIAVGRLQTERVLPFCEIVKFTV